MVFTVSGPKNRIWSNSTNLRSSLIEFGILNSKNRNSNGFEQIRPSLLYIHCEIQIIQWDFLKVLFDGNNSDKD